MVELDEYQQAIVESNESMLVVAPPGGGKTRVLTEKARRLFNSGQNILCLCFTRSAAREMASRVPGLPATTIHSYCCGAVGWKLPSSSMGSEDDGYQYLLQRFLWRQKEDRTGFDWVLVDECQDLNKFELHIALSLADSKFFAVGDPYQSIYGFQRALGPEIVPLLTKRCDFREAILHNNYRSNKMVVDRLNNYFPRDLISVAVKDTGLIAILFRRNDELFETSGFLQNRGVPHHVRLAANQAERKEREYDVIGPSPLHLMTIHASKGHEFDHVILYGWKEAKRGEEKRVYYVAMSRASKSFTEASTTEELLKLVDERDTRESFTRSGPPDYLPV